MIFLVLSTITSVIGDDCVVFSVIYCVCAAVARGFVGFSGVFVEIVVVRSDGVCNFVNTCLFLFLFAGAFMNCGAELIDVIFVCFGADLAEFGIFVVFVIFRVVLCT